MSNGPEWRQIAYHQHFIYWQIYIDLINMFVTMLFSYHTTGNRIAPQHIKSTKMKISAHVARLISPSSLSSMIISATFASICSGITIINNFLSLSANICLINVQPVPIKTIVIKSTAPFSLWKHKKRLDANFIWSSYYLQNKSHTKSYYSTYKWVT